MVTYRSRSSERLRVTLWYGVALILLFFPACVINNIAQTYISNVHNDHGCQTIMLNAHVRHELQFHSP